MAETIILDPTEIISSRTQIDITNFIKYEGGVDWGDAAIEAYMAQAQTGQLPVDYRVPNRQISIPLSLRAVGATPFETIRLQLQAKVGLWQREGGSIKRVTSVGTVFADVVNASLKLGGSGFQAYKSFDIDAVLTLEALPEFYGAEIDLGDNITTTAPALTFTDTGVKGDYPGRVRIVVDNDQATDQRGLIWGVRSRHYNSSAAAALAYPAPELTQITTNLGSGWTTLFSTDRDSGTAPLGALVHTGTYRVWARLGASGTEPVQFRFIWDIGDFTLPVENDPVNLNRNIGTNLLDLGEIRLVPPTTGTHRWKGALQGKGSGSETVVFDHLYLVPVDEGYGFLRAPPNSDLGLTLHSGRDEFNQSAGVLTGKTAPVGGAWVGAGDADDFSVETTGKTAQRTAVSDASGTTGGRFCTLNLNMTTTAVQVDFKASALQASGMGVIARWIDINNWFYAYVWRLTGATNLFIARRVAGTVTEMSTGATVSPQLEPNTWYTIRLGVNADGTYGVWYGLQGGTLPLAHSGYNSTLAAAGALATGDPGIIDVHTSANADTRNYDNFGAWVPPSDAVAFASQSVQLGTDGMFREDSAGAAWGPISTVGGDLPRIPPSGLEGRTVEWFIKMSRGDLAYFPDNDVDDLSARVFYRPSWLFIPVA